MRTLLREALKGAALRLPPFQKLVSERNFFAAESRRLQRQLDERQNIADSSATVPKKSLPSELPKKLNVGCGFDHRAGYLNVDLQARHNPDLLGDAKSLPMLPTGYFDEILAIDVLEHLHRDDTETALAEWSRLLAVGGVLQLRVPSILDLAELLKKTDNILRQVAYVQNLYGTQAYTGDYHYTGFTRTLLHHYLKNAGLQPEPEANWLLIDGWMIELRASKPAEA